MKSDAAGPGGGAKNAAAAGSDSSTAAGAVGAGATRDADRLSADDRGRDAHDAVNYDPVQAAIEDEARRVAERESAVAAAEQESARAAVRDKAARDKVAQEQAARDKAAQEARAASAAGTAGGASGAKDAARSSSTTADATSRGSSSVEQQDPVAAALARAQAARERGDSDGGAAVGTTGGVSDGSGGAPASNVVARANTNGGDPVADALQRAEQALRDAEREDAERRGRVETAGKGVQINENEKQQTLGGMLPLTLDMDERGLFEFDRYELRNEVKSTLDVLAEKLKAAEYDRLVIAGYSDRIGTDEYNKLLSDKRAWAVAGYLMDRGVPPHKLKVEGRGERDSVVGDEACEGLKRAEMIQCLQRDRRVEIAATVKEYNLRVQ